MNSYQITKKQYNYLLAPFRHKLFHRIDRNIDKYYFMGTYEEYLDMLNRCKYLND